jgi:general nucleoside transport system permease protein
MDYQNILAILNATLRTSTPLIFAALGGLFSERAGIVDIGLEGKMLAAAFVSAALAWLTGSAAVGLLGGIGISLMLSLLHGFATITHRGNQIVSGLAINILASGLTATLGNAWFSRGGQTPPLPDGARFRGVEWPLAENIAHIPVLGPIYSELLSGHSGFVYAAILLVPIVWWTLYRTRFGLRLRAVGEYPAAVDTSGISVAFIRYRAVAVTGLLCGAAGTYLSLAQNAGFGRDMVAGRGYLALAALIFSNWRPVPVLFACLLFGFLDAMQARMQGTELWGIAVPVELIQAAPYILTVVLLAGVAGKSVPPRAAGTPYTKER